MALSDRNTQRFNKLIVTVDLDAIANVKQNLEKAGYKKDVDYFTVGLDKPGYRCVEGLLPDFIRQSVNSENNELVLALQSENKEERKIAKDKLKQLYFEEFKKNIKYDETYFENFYVLINKINKRLK